MRPMQFFDPPLLKYFGSKWRMADFIIGHFPSHQLYIEPYCGGAAVFLRKWPVQIEDLNDINSDVVNFFDILRSRTAEFASAIELTPFSFEEFQRAFEPTDDPFERAPTGGWSQRRTPPTATVPRRNTCGFRPRLLI